MSNHDFTIDDLARVLVAAAGDEGVDFEANVDTEFEDLGYDSLALLEAHGRIEREYGVALDEDALVEASTPRRLLDVVSRRLTAVT